MLINRHESKADDIRLLCAVAHLIVGRTLTGGGRPLEGTYLLSCSRTDGRSAAQAVGSFVTKASKLAPKVPSKAPEVVGKSADWVVPVT